MDTQRHLFDIPADVAYFNAAYNGPQLRQSTRALEQAVRNKGRPWIRTSDSFFEDAETVRSLAAGAFGGEADGYAIVPSATYGVTTAARAIEPTLRPGDRIICIEEDFPAAWLPWQTAASHSGACLVQVPAKPEATVEDRLIDEIERGARVVSMCTVRWTDGTRYYLSRIARAARMAGAAFVLDATQSLAAAVLDLEDVQPDFLVAAGYKWLLCPYGFGLMHVSPAWRNARPLEESWIAREASENFANLTHPSSAYRAGARRFDVSETCAETIMAGAIPALRQIGEWGVQNIENRLFETCDWIRSRLPSSLRRIAPERSRSHILGLTLPDGVSRQVSMALAARNVYVSVRGQSLRIAPHLHVTRADLARLVDALEAVDREQALGASSR
jgi:selenocysteine lyase/cysteine desulfurase